jgi:hypothetical protein
MSALYKAKKKRYLSYEDLPAGTKDLFKKRVIPLSLEATGTLKPWLIPKDKEIIETWNYVYDKEYQIESDDTECDRFVVAKTLVSNITFIYHMLTFHLIPKSNTRYRAGSTNLQTQQKGPWSLNSHSVGSTQMKNVHALFYPFSEM